MSRYEFTCPKCGQTVLGDTTDSTRIVEVVVLQHTDAEGSLTLCTAGGSRLALERLTDVERVVGVRGE